MMVMVWPHGNVVALLHAVPRDKIPTTSQGKFNSHAYQMQRLWQQGVIYCKGLPCLRMQKPRALRHSAACLDIRDPDACMGTLILREVNYVLF
jgi:hypothetical protein